MSLLRSRFNNASKVLDNFYQGILKDIFTGTESSKHIQVNIENLIYFFKQLSEEYPVEFDASQYLSQMQDMEKLAVAYKDCFSKLLEVSKAIKDLIQTSNVSYDIETFEKLSMQLLDAASSHVQTFNSHEKSLKKLHISLKGYFTEFYAQEQKKEKEFAAMDAFVEQKPLKAIIHQIEAKTQVVAALSAEHKESLGSMDAVLEKMLDETSYKPVNDDEKILKECVEEFRTIHAKILKNPKYVPLNDEEKELKEFVDKHRALYGFCQTLESLDAHSLDSSSIDSDFIQNFMTTLDDTCQKLKAEATPSVSSLLQNGGMFRPAIPAHNINELCDHNSLTCK